ncbi:hypothetical protein M0R45_011662 [Rubus argutus]|uniref:Uncharacterized protein n=1 Tax=Rubus argutus TaxID=59490 RepID=A0AAW1YE95_RUBAR
MAESVVEVETVTCHCCGLKEECTPGYIARVREKHQGRWICGLCAMAIEDDRLRSQKKISADEAIKRHIKFYENFRSAEECPSEDSLISAVMQLMRRTLDSPRRNGSGSGRGDFDPRLLRSRSCFAAVGGETEGEQVS